VAGGGEEAVAGGGEEAVAGGGEEAVAHSQSGGHGESAGRHCEYHWCWRWHVSVGWEQHCPSAWQFPHVSTVAVHGAGGGNDEEGTGAAEGGGAAEAAGGEEARAGVGEGDGDSRGGVVDGVGDGTLDGGGGGGGEPDGDVDDIACTSGAMEARSPEMVAVASATHEPE